MESSEGTAAKPGPKPKIIGLTGGIGSGKTTVAKIIETAGYPVYYSDVRAKELVNEDTYLKERIRDLLGSEAYDEYGFYNRKFVAGLVFENNELLDKLNATIHPAVKHDFESWIAAQNAEMVFKETALLFELHLDDACDKSVLVTADDNMRIKRVMDRDGRTYREVEAIMDRQMPEKDKVKKADYVVYNNESMDTLQLEVKTLLATIQEDVSLP